MVSAECYILSVSETIVWLARYYQEEPLFDFITGKNFTKIEGVIVFFRVE